ncbi:MAG: hypothetical protein Kow00107_04080 [Planctomycetota bacterium]
MFARRTLSTIAVLLLAGASAWYSISIGSFVPLAFLSLVVLFLSFLESVSFVTGRRIAKTLLFFSCCCVFASITLLSDGPATPTVQALVTLPVPALMAGLLGVLLFLAANAMFWFSLDYRKSAAEVGWFYIVFVYYALLAPLIFRVMLFPNYIVWDPSLGRWASPDHAIAAGVYFFLGSVLVAKFTDIGAYLGGLMLGRKLFGGRKMAPRISPKKTMAGLLFGVLTAVVAGFLFLYLNPFGRFHVAILILFGPLVGFLTIGGDLMESVFKRSFNLKDSGATLPGIGGVFDLTDSLFWAVPGAYALFLLNFWLV